jgi:hypothetical protein
MDGTGDKHLGKLAGLLRSYLGRTLRLNSDAEAFVTATYGDAEPETLKALTADIDASEAETFLELLLFPDIQFQIAIEPHLFPFKSERLSQRRLRNLLTRPPVSLTLELHENQAALQFPLPEDFLERFLARLNLARRWPASLEDAFDTHLALADRLRARVMLRNGPPWMGDGFPGLCADLVRALPPKHRDFWPALELVIQLAPELTARSDPFALLTARKRRAFQMVEQQRDFEHRLRRSNIETLLGQGQRVPALARGEALRQMRVIDAVCQSVFGRTTYFQPALLD